MITLTTWDNDQRVQPARLWMSEQQWMALLTRIQRESEGYEGPERRNARLRNHRHPTRLRCVIRAQEPDGRSGTYLVRSHNVSAGGLGFLHTQPLPRGSRCTIALERREGQGLITSGHVAWARQVDEEEQAFEVGIQFDRPIDPAPFTSDLQPIPA